MNELQAALNVVVSNTFVMAFKAQSFHWNVEGRSFHMYHKFYQEIYDDLFEAVDELAESIRMIDGFAPYSLDNILEYSTIKEEKSSKCNMVKSLIDDNDEVINSLDACFQLAEEENDQGLMDLLGSRIRIHKKFGWMLKSTDKEDM